MAQASALGDERMLLLALFLADNLLGADLPDWVLRKVNANPAVETLAREICEQLFGDPDGQAELFEEAHFHPLHLKMKERLRDKIRFCVRAVATQSVEDWKLLPLPDFLFAFYYVVRPIRLIGKYALRIRKRLL